jgi:CMP-N-acetylneuraminic acid synthetase
MWRIPDPASGVMQPYLQTPFRLSRGPDVPRAELETVYWQNGVVDVTRRSVILDQGVMIGRTVAGLVTDSEDSADLDTPFDLLVAELLIQQRRQREGGTGA